ncbi:GntR family transcriptional regulator [Parapedobacter indicus]|uniref:Transcriptional regulator, GntR family n=1 Tax=Parapedobacter indicus TaxID=1477437 RepID=A0A1I3PKR1_9SPHI|nr:GntR family transcriptional regulator [Parapedobacter indicus]PPL00495.1 GntR family transcriptional regulator [Parapedobacter indicus]SFJ22294.1 transcriptional regulator, GntR family [Parapedobacter indicus]
MGIESTEHNPRSGSRMKYLQLVDYINHLVESDQLHIGDRIPSLKQLEKKLGMSKETLLKGLTHLLEKGIIESVYRKGYYVKKKSVDHTYRVFLLLDKMNVMRDRFYHTLFEELKNVADMDIYFHHHNFKVFENLIRENLGNYTHFVVATFLKENPSEVLNLIPAQKRIIIDYNQPDLDGEYSCIFQDFEHDIYDGLTQLKDQLSKYKKLILIAPHEATHARHVMDGFLRFCVEHAYRYAIEHEVEASSFQKGNGYITFSRYDTDDVALIKLARSKNYKLGSDVGLISYNDTAVKEILEDGITVISTDFEAMGKAVSQAIMNKEIVTFRNPTRVVLRNSL